ncbi:MAG: HEAT repeat domain-containing protein [Acidobacteria bacterium]|nr:HEAT repeat domain-containing protein [Acidobacteriota bacterium]
MPTASPGSHYLRNMHSVGRSVTLGRGTDPQENAIPPSATNLARGESARAFVHSLNILVKYVRLYGFAHKRTEAQFHTAWKELQSGLPSTGEAGFLLGVSGSTLLLDGIPLETGQAERTFAQLLTAAGLASIHFSPKVSQDDFAQLVRAFATSGSKAQDIAQQIKRSLAEIPSKSIKINEVKFIATDPETGEVSVAAQIAAQTLGPEFKQWLNDPQKLLQLIAAAEGAQRAGDAAAGNAAAAGSTPATGTRVSSSADGRTVPLEEEEVIQAIRLLTQFGKSAQDPNPTPELLQRQVSEVTPSTRINLEQLLRSLASKVSEEEHDTPLLMRAAEHMAIRFALERYQRGDVKVNAVHQMMEHMSRQMNTLRQILKVQEEKMSKAGLLVESHADILDRMFWSEVPEAGKKSVLLSKEAACVPPRNIRQYLEQLLERGDHEAAEKILDNYVTCLDSKDPESRRKIAIGLSQLADLVARIGSPIMGTVIQRVSKTLAEESEAELQSLLSAAFVRFSQEAINRRRYGSVAEVLRSLEQVSAKRELLAKEMQSRIGVENRLPEFIDEAIRSLPVPQDLVEVLRRVSPAFIEHLADRFFRCMQRDECDRLIALVKMMGPDAFTQLRETLRTGPPRQASSVVGLLSRLDVSALLELLPARLREWNRFYHDVVVRQIAFGAAVDRGRTMLELLEVLDPLVLPQAIDEIGMSGDRSAAPPLMVLAEPGESQARSLLIQLKAIESLGRLRHGDAVPVLRTIVESKKMWKFVQPRELRIAAAQSLNKIDARFANQLLADNDLENGELSIGALDAQLGSIWVRQRRYERFVLSRSMPALLTSSWGRSRITVREMSLGGGMGTKDDNQRIGSEATIEISLGMRKITAQVLLRRARVNEIGFEIVNVDLESRYRLRRVLMEAMQQATQFRTDEWDGQRKT